MTAAAARLAPSALEPDEVEVERLVYGRIRFRDAHPASRRAAVRQLTEKGKAAHEIADRLRTTERTVVWIWARDRAAGLLP